VFKVGLITRTLYGISIMLTKLSILTLFLRFIPLGNLRVAIYIIMAIVIMHSLVATFSWVYACRPIEKYWNPTITRGSCINTFKVAVFGAVMNITTDTIALTLPVLFLWNLHLPTREKIGVIIILMTGGFVLIASIVRLKILLDQGISKDYTWDVIPPYLCLTIELHAAVVCACLPAGKPFLRKYIPSLIGSNGSASTRIEGRTICLTSIQHLPSRDPNEVRQNIILEDNINGKLRRHT
ncbi:hypothetical protein GQ44DRAFT_613437, partial [Phaeosphaeriaceae sp. PMI808]